jgi:hypothetical protein
MGEASFSETMVLVCQFISCTLKKRGIFNTTVGTEYLAEYVSALYRVSIPGYIPALINFTLVFVFFFKHST